MTFYSSFFFFFFFHFLNSIWAAQSGAVAVVGGNDVESGVVAMVGGRGAARGAGTVGVPGRGASSAVQNSKSKGKRIVTNVDKGIEIMESKMKKTKLPWRR
ncbi:hypothetical protein FH972_012600 [Carpinus fangiana]|uniref:Uncharacterized protein n=1 Tax=Carpinus fangiana TaxID=176857 RepID=A0A5N6R7G1_9ROSI|nr:hypothetical protein FH972_012600 [Carpinus fangiana]